jgi:urocanate hydratase
MEWDVMNGIARRAWARNGNALETAAAWNRDNTGRGLITLPHLADDALVDRLVERSFPNKTK